MMPKSYKYTKDKMSVVESYGNIPSNIGYDPHLAWRWRCSRCGQEGYVFADQVSLPVRDELKKNWRSYRKIRCKRCHDSVRVVEKLPKLKAFHLNDIRHRSSNFDHRSVGLA